MSLASSEVKWLLLNQIQTLYPSLQVESGKKVLILCA